MSRAYSMHIRAAQAGVGLIEVLIALLVLSIGMLGMAGLQMWSLKNNQGSMERGMAVMQTHTIADAMRADRTVAINNGFNVAFSDAIEEIEGGNAYATAALRDWRTNLQRNLGAAATGEINCNGSATCVIRIQWQDRQAQRVDAEEVGVSTQELMTEVRL
jgi:type IV pilus assembly protein PilV